MRLLLVAFGVVIGLLAKDCLAELHECDGVWVNRPCEGKSSQDLEEVDTKQIDVAAREVKEKKFWINDIELKRLRAAKEYDLNMSVGDVVSLCNSVETSLAECRKAIAARENEMEKAVLDAKNLALKKERLVEEKKRRAEQEEMNQVNVFDNRTVIIKKGNGGKRHEEKASGGEHSGQVGPKERPVAEPSPSGKLKKSKKTSQVEFQRETGGLEEQ